MPPGTPTGEVNDAGFSTPAITPMVRKSFQFLSAPTAAKKSGVIL